VDRMLYGQLKEFGDAELAALVAPQPLRVYYTRGGPTEPRSLEAELKRARRFYAGLQQEQSLTAEEMPTEEGFAHVALKMASELGATAAGSPPAVALKVSREFIERVRNDSFDTLHEYLRQLD